MWPHRTGPTAASSSSEGFARAETGSRTVLPVSVPRSGGVKRRQHVLAVGGRVFRAEFRRIDLGPDESGRLAKPLNSSGSSGTVVALTPRCYDGVRG